MWLAFRRRRGFSLLFGFGSAQFLVSRRFSCRRFRVLLLPSGFYSEQTNMAQSRSVREFSAFPENAQESTFQAILSDEHRFGAYSVTSGTSLASLF